MESGPEHESPVREVVGRVGLISWSRKETDRLPTKASTLGEDNIKKKKTRFQVRARRYG